jgi:hypothetical protein
MTPTVATPSATQSAIAEAAKLPRTLMRGTAGMRAAGALYLPAFTRESREAHVARIHGSTLFNAFGKTIRDLTGRVFRNPIVLKDDVSQKLRELAENIDLQGRHLNVFAAHAFGDALVPGIGYILVDMPRAAEGVRTLAEEKATGARPYLVYVPAERLIAWKSEMRNGVETLIQVRISETVSEPDGDWGEKDIEQIRVLEPGTWRVFRKSQGNATGEWVEHDKGTNSIKDRIPLVPIYTNRTGFMTGSPPLQELADLNVAHWQSSSDQRNILHVARVPILVGSGFEEKDVIEVGASSMVRTSNPDAKVYYAEHSGKAIDAGQRDIERLEWQMQQVGLQLLVPNHGQTATGEMRDDSKERSTLAAMADSLGDSIEAALGFMAEYLGLGKDAGGSVSVNSDFGVIAAGDFASLLNAVNSGQISRVTFLAECKRRNLLMDDLDIDAELLRLEAEESPRGMDLDAA